ncbi:MAG: NADH-quinone oxidoreductase subunit L [Candidatus Hermodarchaeota archaeon]
MDPLLLRLSPFIPALPFLAVPLIILFRKKTNGGAIFSISANLISWILSMGLFIFGLIDFANGNFIQHEEIWYTFLRSPQIEFGVLIDPLSVLMAAIVSTLALLIQIYSLGYMKNEPGMRSGRYFTEITIFVGSMLGLSLSLNFLFLFIFWEGMGLCSYLLIGFYYDKETQKLGTGPASAAKKAFLITKIGDILLFSGFILLMYFFLKAEVSGPPLNFLVGSANVEAVFENNQGWQTLIALLIFGGAVGKSAQFPLHVWLPDAMEGPTTVSALIHSATMVKAGVFLLARVYWIFEGTNALLFVAVIGGFTAIFAATMALVATDIKRVLAYSTISQLAYMILGIGAEGVASGFFHLMSHSIFKCLLFLAAGSIIHSFHNNDIRAIYGLRRSMPKTALTFIVGGLALAGIIPFNGFFSKDAIFATTWLRFEHSGNIIYFLLFLFAVITAFMTGFYIFRVIFHILKSQPTEGFEDHNSHPHESPNIMTYPLLILAALAIISGILSLLGLLNITIPFNPVDEHNLVSWLSVLQLHAGHEVIPFGTTLGLAILSQIVAGSGIIVAFLLYSSVIPKNFLGKVMQTARSFHSTLATTSVGRGAVYILEHRYGIDGFYRSIGIAIDRLIGELLYRTDKRVLDGAVHSVALGTISLAKVSDWSDRKIIDGIVNGTGSVFLKFGNIISRVQTGITQNYAAGIFIGIIVFIGICFIFFGFGGF